jgi:hypothetical protein
MNKLLKFLNIVESTDCGFEVASLIIFEYVIIFFNFPASAEPNVAPIITFLVSVVSHDLYSRYRILSF